MLAFIVRRLLFGVLTLIIVSMGCFVIIDSAPGDALSAEIQKLQSRGATVTQDQVEALEQRYRVNDPLPVKYWDWATSFVQGDFGYSFSNDAEVNELIWSRIGFSVMLALMSLILAWGIAIPVGVYSATHRYTIPDYIITLIQFIGVAVPEFLLALFLMVVAEQAGIDATGLFSDEYQTAPWSMAKLLDMAAHLWLPVIVIAAGSTAWLTRVMRANLFDVLNQQYVQTARAKGVLEKKVIWKHAVRNALHPLVMALGSTLPILISGEAIIGIVLNLPTMGPLLIEALKQADMFLAVSLLMFSSILLIVGNILADILLAWIDPRVRTVD